MGLASGRIQRTKPSRAPTPPPGRYAVPLACGVLFPSIQLNLNLIFGGWMKLYLMFHDNMAAVVGVIAGFFLLVGLAFAGALLGAGRPVQARPLRVLSATLLTLGVQYVASLLSG